MAWLTYVAGFIIDAFAGLLGLTILLWIWRDKIPLYKLLSEPNGDASLSRLQFLIFTFVIALSFFLIVIGHTPPQFPTSFPPEVLTLLGISGTSYLVSKGIQFSNPAGVARPGLVVTPSAIGPPAPAAPVKLTVTVVNTQVQTPIPALIWSLDAPAEGKIIPQPPNDAQYVPATPVPQAGTKVTIRAQAGGFEDGIAVVTY